MPRFPVVFVVAILVGLGRVPVSRGQWQPAGPQWQPPAAPALPLPPASAPLPPPQTAPIALPPPVAAPAPAIAVPMTPAGPVSPDYRWFGAVEVDAVHPEISHQLSNVVSVAGVAVPVTLGTTGFDWAAAPRIEVGYRLPDGAGDLMASALSINSQGTDTALGFDPFGPASVKSRLNLLAIDLDYGNRIPDLEPCWDVRWRLGVRFASIYLDTTVQGPVFGERATDYFFGVGPVLGVDAVRRLGASRWSAFGRVEAADVIGRIDQSFLATVSAGGVPVLGGATTDSHTRDVPAVRAQFGLRWSPWPDRPFAISSGYVFDGWWHFGQVDTSAATFISNGIFLRGEWAF